MTSEVDICNRALSRLAANRITSFDDNTIEAKECNAIYDMVVQEVQSRGDWPSCKIRSTLAQTTTTPTFGFTYSYQLPTSPQCLRVMYINEDKIGETDYQIENGLLLTDEPSVSILYIANITDPNQFDVYLRQAIIAQLTAEMAYKLSGSVDVAEKLMQRSEQIVTDMIALASLQGADNEIPSDTFVDIRIQGAGGPQEPIA